MTRVCGGVKGLRLVGFRVIVEGQFEEGQCILKQDDPKDRKDNFRTTGIGVIPCQDMKKRPLQICNGP